MIIMLNGIKTIHWKIEIAIRKLVRTNLFSMRKSPTLI